MYLNYNDGGRSDAGYHGKADDCTVRSIAIATMQDYQKVYDELFEMNRDYVAKKGKPGDKASPRGAGTSMDTVKEYLGNLGWEWVPTMLFGQGCTVHLKADELPSGKIICRLSKHLVAVIDGVINDTYDCSRGGSRCVYGYFQKIKII